MVVGWVQKLQEKEWNNDPEISELVEEMGKKRGGLSETENTGRGSIQSG